MSVKLQARLKAILKKFGKSHALIKCGEEFYPYDELQFIYNEKIHEILIDVSSLLDWKRDEVYSIFPNDLETDSEYFATRTKIDDRFFALMPIAELTDCAELTGQFSTETALELGLLCAERDLDPQDFRHIPKLQDFMKNMSEFQDLPNGVITEVTMQSKDQPADTISYTWLVVIAKSNGRMYFCVP